MTTTTPSQQPGTAEAGTSQALELGLVHGSAPWAWTHDRNMEYWHPAGKSRDEAISAGKRHGRKIFWIACTRPMDEDEKEEMEGSWVIDPTTEEKIMPNNSSQRTRPAVTNNLNPPEPTSEPRPGSL